MCFHVFLSSSGCSPECVRASGGQRRADWTLELCQGPTRAAGKGLAVRSATAYAVVLVAAGEMVLHGCTNCFFFAITLMCC